MQLGCRAGTPKCDRSNYIPISATSSLNVKDGGSARGNARRRAVAVIMAIDLALSSASRALHEEILADNTAILAPRTGWFLFLDT